MTIKFNCQACQQRISADSTRIGEIVLCPVCGEDVQVSRETYESIEDVSGSPVSQGLKDIESKEASDSSTHKTSELGSKSEETNKDFLNIDLTNIPEVSPFKGKQGATMNYYYLGSDGKPKGTFSEDQLRELLDEGTIDGTTLITHSGASDWKSYDEMFGNVLEDLPPIPFLDLPPVPEDTQRNTEIINLTPALVLTSVAFGLNVFYSLLMFSKPQAIADAQTYSEIETLLAAYRMWFYLWVSVQLLAGIFVFILHYKCWKALPVKYRAVTPGKAVGFIFIPFFNFYWAFVTWPKLSEGLTKWQQNEGYKGRNVDDTSGLSLTYAILFVCVLLTQQIPGIAILTATGQFVIFILLYRRVVTTINKLHGFKKLANIS